MATKGKKGRKGEGVSSKLNPKPRINKQGKGYRVFQGRRYLGFFPTKREAEARMRSHSQACGQDNGAVGGSKAKQESSSM